MKANSCTPLFIFLGLFLATCETQNRTTNLVGKVVDEQGQPLDNIPILIAGLRKGTLSQYDDIQTIYTNKQGEYSIKFDVGKQFRGLDINVDLLKIPDYTSKYRGYTVLLNDQSPSVCCPAQIGYTAKYDFKLLNR